MASVTSTIIKVEDYQVASIAPINKPDDNDEKSSENVTKHRNYFENNDYDEEETSQYLALLANKGPSCSNPFKGQKFYKCNDCGKRYWNHEEHMLTHQSERPFQCAICPKNFRTKANLNHHQRSHLNKLTKKYKCDECSSFFATNSQLKRHKLVHSKELPYKCDQCYKSFRVKGHLYNHRRSQHSSKKCRIPLEKCHICGKGCHNMTAHLRVHSGERDFVCDFCHGSFKSKHNLSNHMAIHINARNHQCELCPRKFNYKTQLTRHIQSHSTYLPFVCDVCGAAYKYVNSLRIHMRGHTGERPYPCEQCEKSFTTSVSLRLHVRVHTGEKPYKCDICNRGFADGSTMKIHKRVHTGEQPYICHLCGKSAKQASNLKSHYKHFHKIYDITGKQIRYNARVFAKYKTEIFNNTDLQEILNRAAADQQVIVEEAQPTDNSNNNFVQFDNQPIDLKPSSVKCETYTQNPDVGSQFDDSYSEDSFPDLSPPEQQELPAFHAMANIDQKQDFSNLNQYLNIANCTSLKSEFKCPPNTDSKKNIEIIDCRTLNNDFPQTIAPELSENRFEKSADVEIPQIPKIKKEKPPKIEEIMIEEKPNEIDIENIKIEKESEENGEDFSWFNMNENLIHYSMETFQNRPSQLKEETIRKIQKAIKKETAERLALKTDEFDDEMFAADTVENKPTTKGVKYQKCDICNRRYISTNHDEHMRSHTSEKPFQCEHCPKTFKQREYLKLHQKYHTDVKNVMCDQCGKAFYHNHDLRRHMKRHSDDRPHECSTCGKKFKEPHGLKNHIRTHSGEKPFKCQTCDKSFSSKMGVKLHLRTHTGEKPYKCTYCESSFGDGSTYRQHVRTHTGERPYRCHLCGKGTTQAGNLKSHLRHYHKLIVKHVNMCSTKFL